MADRAAAAARGQPAAAAASAAAAAVDQVIDEMFRKDLVYARGRIRSDADLVRVAKALRSPRVVVKNLILRDNNNNSAECCCFRATSATELASALLVNSTLEKLTFAECALQPGEFVPALCRGLLSDDEDEDAQTQTTKSKLELLRLSTCKIGFEDAVALATLIGGGGGGASHLKSLSLFGNETLGDRGAAALAKALKECPAAPSSSSSSSTLRELNVMDCGISDEGMCALASALQCCAFLERLHVRGNPQVTVPGGWSKLVKALESNTSLLELQMENQPPEKAMEALSTRVKACVKANRLLKDCLAHEAKLQEKCDHYGDSSGDDDDDSHDKDRLCTMSPQMWLDVIHDQLDPHPAAKGTALFLALRGGLGLQAYRAASLRKLDKSFLMVEQAMEEPLATTTSSTTQAMQHVMTSCSPAMATMAA